MIELVVTRRGREGRATARLHVLDCRCASKVDGGGGFGGVPEEMAHGCMACEIGGVCLLLVSSGGLHAPLVSVQSNARQYPGVSAPP
jgi:hypothetical protein